MGDKHILLLVDLLHESIYHQKDLEEQNKKIQLEETAMKKKILGIQIGLIDIELDFSNLTQLINFL